MSELVEDPGMREDWHDWQQRLDGLSSEARSACLDSGLVASFLLGLAFTPGKEEKLVDS